MLIDKHTSLQSHKLNLQDDVILCDRYLFHKFRSFQCFNFIIEYSYLFGQHSYDNKCHYSYIDKQRVLFFRLRYYNIKYIVYYQPSYLDADIDYLFPRLYFLVNNILSDYLIKPNIQLKLF